jgi:glycosyltransferase involved in cell wall biosynthesis
MEHGRTGWLVNPADGPALAEGIRLLLENAELRRRLGKAARQSIIERFNWRKNAEQVVGVYEEAIAKRRG